MTPAGRVPVLHDDGLVIWDSLAICEYLAEQFPALWPADRATRARARSISAEMHSGFGELRHAMPIDVTATDKRGQGHTTEALADARRVQHIWREALARPATTPGPLLFGAFTIADAMFAPVATRFVTYDLDPACQAYVDAIYALPAIHQWIADATTKPSTRS